ncbi:MAG: FAD-dependent oxidoreductase, partial [Microcoleus sp.]
GTKGSVTVIGAGIGGLTAAALLARRGYQVLVLDQAIVPGGCASTFKRKGFTSMSARRRLQDWNPEEFITAYSQN